MTDQIKKIKEELAGFNESSKQAQLALPDRKTAEDFIQALETFAATGASVREVLGDLAFDYSWNKEVREKVALAGFERASSFGGEGQGDNYYVIVKWNSQFWMVPGWYNSDEGGEYHLSDAYEVYPIVNVETDYSAMK